MNTPQRKLWPSTTFIHTQVEEGSQSIVLGPVRQYIYRRPDDRGSRARSNACFPEACRAERPMLVHKPREVSIESTRVNSWSNWSAEQYTPPRHGNINYRAEEKENDELGKAASHGNILRHIFPSPAAFGAAAPGSPGVPRKSYPHFTHRESMPMKVSCVLSPSANPMPS